MNTKQRQKQRRRRKESQKQKFKKAEFLAGLTDFEAKYLRRSEDNGFDPRPRAAYRDLGSVDLYKQHLLDKFKRAGIEVDRRLHRRINRAMRIANIVSAKKLLDSIEEFSGLFREETDLRTPCYQGMTGQRAARSQSQTAAGACATIRRQLKAGVGEVPPEVDVIRATAYDMLARLTLKAEKVKNLAFVIETRPTTLDTVRGTREAKRAASG